MANLLERLTQDVVHADDYVRYAQTICHQHYLNGEPDLQEDYNPDNGRDYNSRSLINSNRLRHVGVICST